MTMRCVPEEPTMGQWDDFCKVHSVPFDEFERAYKAMMKDAPPPPADIDRALRIAKDMQDSGMESVVNAALLKSWGRE